MADIIIDRSSPSFIASRVIWTLVGVVNTILGLRVLLKIIAANPGAGFTDLVYSVSAVLLSPFANIVRSSRLDNGGIIEWSSLIAMLVYYLIGLGLVSLFTINKPTTIEKI